MQIYLGHWEWVIRDDGETGWRAPGGNARGVLDLRPLPAQGTAGGAPQGYGIFVYDGPRSHPLLLEDLGDAPDVLLPARSANAMSTLLGVSLTRDNLRNTLRQALLDPAAYDPTGAARWKPLRCSSQRKCRLLLKPWGLMFDEAVDESHPATASTVAVFRADYQRMRDAAETLSTERRTRSIDALKRYTGSTMRKLYRRMDDALADSILPAAYRLDGWTPPQTTFTESWPTNSTTISTGQDQPWNEDALDVTVDAGRLKKASAAEADAWGRCLTDLSSDDHRHTCTMNLEEANDSSSGGPSCRKIDSTAQTYYAMVVSRRTSDPFQLLLKFVGGTFTLLDDLAADPGAGDITVYVEADGDQIEGAAGASVFGPVTDTAITGNLQVGYTVRDDPLDTVFFDNHTATDLVAATRMAGRRALLGVGF